MKLVIAIAPDAHARVILQCLTDATYRATLISTTGGFLRQGNTTLLVGVEAHRLDDLLKRIEKACANMPRPSARQSSATVFVLDVQQYARV